jgi:hypothetical protein
LLVAGDNLLVAGDNLSVAGDKLLVAGHKLLVAGHKLLVAGHNLLVAGHKLLVAGHNLLVAGHKLLVAGHKLLVAGHKLLVAGDKLSVAGDKLLVAGHNLLVAGDKLSVAGDNLLVAGHKLPIAGERCPLRGDQIAVAGVRHLWERSEEAGRERRGHLASAPVRVTLIRILLRCYGMCSVSGRWADSIETKRRHREEGVPSERRSFQVRGRRSILDLILVVDQVCCSAVATSEDVTATFVLGELLLSLERSNPEVIRISGLRRAAASKISAISSR